MDFLKNGVSQVRCQVEPVHPFPLRLIGHSLQTRRTDEEACEIFQNIPEHLQRKLMEFQTEGVST